jgi:hypothetical protein
LSPSLSSFPSQVLLQANISPSLPFLQNSSSTQESITLIFLHKCFIQESQLPKPDLVYEKDFGIVGILGTDYATFVQSGYQKFWSRSRLVVKEWSTKDRLSKGPRSCRTLTRTARKQKTTATTAGVTKIVQVEPTHSSSINATPALPKTAPTFPPIDQSLRNSKRRFMLTPRLGPAKRQKVTKPCAKARTSRKQILQQVRSKFSLRGRIQNARLSLSEKLLSLACVRPLPSGMTIDGHKESMTVQGTRQLVQPLSDCHITANQVSTIDLLVQPLSDCHITANPVSTIDGLQDVPEMSL